MNIKTDCANYPGLDDWNAWDEDTYDGAPDGNNMMGVGQTELEAVQDLIDQMRDEDERTTI